VTGDARRRRSRIRLIGNSAGQNETLCTQDLHYEVSSKNDVYKRLT